MSLFTPSAWIARLLRIAGIVLLVIGLCPSYVVRGDGLRMNARWQVGMDTSPLFLHERNTTSERDAEGRETTMESWSWNFELFSWSMAAFVAGVVLLAAARAMRRESSERAETAS